MKNHRALALAILLSILPRTSFAAPPAASSAAATPPPETPAMRAAKIKSSANQAMLDMHYADALRLYEESRELAPDDVTVLYSIARAYEFLGEFPEALDAMERFAKDAPPDAKAKVGRVDALLADLRARVATLTVRCNVSGARVIVRDKIVGTTPLPPVRMNAGAATVQIDIEGFFPARRDIVLPGAEQLTIEVEMRARSNSGILSVTTQPLGARVFVDGNLAGTSSPRLELALPAGAHNLSAARDGYHDATVPIILTAGSSREVALTLDEVVPITKRWWFWTGIGVAIVGGIVVTAALLTERKPEQGTLAPGKIAAPLIRF